MISHEAEQVQPRRVLIDRLTQPQDEPLAILVILKDRPPLHPATDSHDRSPPRMEHATSCHDEGNNRRNTGHAQTHTKFSRAGTNPPFDFVLFLIEKCYFLLSRSDPALLQHVAYSLTGRYRKLFEGVLGNVCDGVSSGGVDGKVLDVVW